MTLNGQENYGHLTIYSAKHFYYDSISISIGTESCSHVVCTFINIQTCQESWFPPLPEVTLRYVTIMSINQCIINVVS